VGVATVLFSSALVWAAMAARMPATVNFFAAVVMFLFVSMLSYAGFNYYQWGIGGVWIV
jgi:hypothetical protein